LALRILLLALAIMSSSAQAQSWIDSIVQGDDKSASNQLSHIAQAQEAYDLMTLSNQLRRGVSNCPEKDKKILFRGYRNPAFENVGTAKRRIYLSRALMTQKGGSNPNGFADLKGVNLLTLLSRHVGWYKTYPSPFLSVTSNLWMARSFGGTANLLVLKICKDRLYPGTENERESLVPYFIHPDEILAVIKDERNVLYSSLPGATAEQTLKFIKNADDRNEEAFNKERQSCGSKLVYQNEIW